MKEFKISLVVIIIVAISVGTFFWIQNIKEPEKVKAPENQFTTKIELEIEQIKAKPDNKFCKDYYNEVAFHIKDFYMQGRFGKNVSENNLWKENLEKNLYVAYVDKFISQAFYVFRGSVWEFDDLKFIRNEYQTLQKSILLESGSPVDKKFTEIQTVFSKYDEIAGFISICKGFSYSSSRLIDRFPISEVQAKISRAAKYQNNSLENGYVDNCKRLHDELKEIPQILFRSHVKYLDFKVSDWSGLYSNYNSQSAYVNLLYKPLRSEIDALDKNIYNVVNFDGEYQRLINKWSFDNSNAYSYSYPKMQ